MENYQLPVELENEKYCEGCPCISIDNDTAYFCCRTNEYLNIEATGTIKTGVLSSIIYSKNRSKNCPLIKEKEPNILQAISAIKKHLRDDVGYYSAFAGRIAFHIHKELKEFTEYKAGSDLVNVPNGAAKEFLDTFIKSET